MSNFGIFQHMINDFQNKLQWVRKFIDSSLHSLVFTIENNNIVPHKHEIPRLNPPERLVGLAERAGSPLLPSTSVTWFGMTRDISTQGSGASGEGAVKDLLVCHPELKPKNLSTLFR
jgi:hypothetical protein